MVAIEGQAETFVHGYGFQAIVTPIQFPNDTVSEFLFAALDKIALSNLKYNFTQNFTVTGPNQIYPLQVPKPRFY